MISQLPAYGQVRFGTARQPKPGPVVGLSGGEPNRDIFFSGRVKQDPALVESLRNALTGLLQGGDPSDLPAEFSYGNLIRCFPAIADLLDNPYTRFDCDEIVAERKRILQVHHEFLRNHGVMNTAEIDTPVREKFRDHLAQRLYGEGAERKERKVFILMGLPGAGKSSVAVPLAEREGAMLIDGDTIRQQIPEYHQTHCVELVGREEEKIKAKLLDKVYQEGDNFAMPLPPRNMADITEPVREFIENGYEPHLVYIDTTSDNVLDRILKRFRVTGRLGVTFDTRFLNTDRVDTLYDKLKESGLFETCSRYDNNAPLGVPPEVTDFYRRPAEQAEQP